eukprot:12904603-Prorocentrum_lima.AAC.1
MHLPSTARLAKRERRPAAPAPVQAASPCRAPALQCQCTKSVRRWGARFAFHPTVCTSKYRPTAF